MTKANTHTRGRTETGIVFLLLVVVVVSTTVSADDQIRWLNSLRAGTGILTISMAHNSIHEKVYGRFNTMVHVYVPMHRASPTLYCRSWHMRHRDLLESTVIWIGPAGVLHNGRHTNITQDKGVMLKNAQAWMSGEYSCMITYNTLSGKKSHQLHFGFIVFVFRDPDVMYTMQVRYLTNNCRLSRNNQMMKTLQQEWNHQIRTLKSHITGLKSNCYHVDYPVLGPKNELNVSFTVNPYGNQWLEKCLKYPLPHCKIALNSRMEKVKNLFRQYFKEEKERLEDLHHLMLDFHYIGGSLKILEDLFCRPGFGINNVQHSTCFNCCVVCSPGEYSSTYEPYCKKCAHMGKEEYGAAYC